MANFRDSWKAKEETKEEAKPVFKEEVKTAVIEPKKEAVEEKQQSTVLLSNTDAYIHDRLKSQPKTFDDVEVKASREQGQERILALPRELENYNDRYAFRWIKKHPRAISYHLDVMNWALVTRNLFNDIPKHLYTANGTVERGDLILGFMPLKRAQELRLEPVKKSQERVRNTPLQDLSKPWVDRGDSYFKPTSGVSDSGDEAENRKPGDIVVQPE